VLVEVPSPFGDKERATAPENIADFLNKVAEHEPDIVLLDYGYSIPLPLQDSPAHERPLLRRRFHNAILIAAGGNEGASKRREEATAPGVYPEILAIGSIDSHGQLQPYAEWIPELSKPDLFMIDQLAGTPLESALKRDVIWLDTSLGPSTSGSSFAALHAVGAAILVWSIIPDLTGDELRELLYSASQPVETCSKRGPRMLTVQADLNAMDYWARKIPTRILDLQGGSPVPS